MQAVAAEVAIAVLLQLAAELRPLAVVALAAECLVKMEFLALLILAVAVVAVGTMLQI
jgi:hypothetical protein